MLGPCTIQDDPPSIEQTRPKDKKKRSLLAKMGSNTSSRKMAGNDEFQGRGIDVCYFQARAIVARQIVNVVEGIQATLLKEVAHAIGLRNKLLVALVVYRVMQMSGKRRVTQTVRLRRCDIGTIVGRGSVHGRLVTCRARRLESRGIGSLTSKYRRRLCRL